MYLILLVILIIHIICVIASMILIKKAIKGSSKEKMKAGIWVLVAILTVYIPLLLFLLFGFLAFSGTNGLGMIEAFNTLTSPWDILKWAGMLMFVLWMIVTIITSPRSSSTEATQLRFAYVFIVGVATIAYFIRFGLVAGLSGEIDFGAAISSAGLLVGILLYVWGYFLIIGQTASRAGQKAYKKGQKKYKANILTVAFITLILFYIKTIINLIASQNGADLFTLSSSSGTARAAKISELMTKVPAPLNQLVPIFYYEYFDLILLVINSIILIIASKGQVLQMVIGVITFIIIRAVAVAGQLYQYFPYFEIISPLIYVTLWYTMFIYTLSEDFK
ncbi:MAG: hypothetical protein ACTSR8_12290 [Promethearchaeota archaeon]